MSQIIASVYEIKQQLGAGGGGVVYLGRHMRLDKEIVLKADKRKLSEKTSEALRREVEALKNLSHMYIPQVYDFVVEDGVVYTVMDFIQGESLSELLERGERPGQPQVIKWARQLLEALVYLHSPSPQHPYGILHSDIKPANIMLTPQGDIRLIDFNIALALGEEGAVAVGRSFGYASPEHYSAVFSSRETVTVSASPGTGITSASPETNMVSAPPETGDTVMTVQSAETAPPPSQSRSSSFSGTGTSNKKGVILDVRSDIYGLGATLYHLLTGNRPARDIRETIALSAADFGIAPVINKAMNPDPALRYQSAAEMLYDINHLHDNDPRTRRHKRRRLGVLLSLTALFAAGLFSAFTGLAQMERMQNAYALSEYSAGALAEGDVPRAVSLALEALPDKRGIFIPPPAAQAVKALADALGVYDLRDIHRPFKTYSLPSVPFTVALSPDGKLAAAVYAYEVAVFETASAETVATLHVTRSALAEAVFLSENILLFAGDGGICAYDILKREILWTGGPATGIAVSADRGTVAAVYRDDDKAVIYGAGGAVKGEVSFGGNRQPAAIHDMFANPGYSLFSLNNDGTLLAASFADGSLSLFSLNGDGPMPIIGASDFYRYQGGFSNNIFAFSASGGNRSVFAAIYTDTFEQAAGYESANEYSVTAGETGIFVSHENTVTKYDFINGEETIAARADGEIILFASDGNNMVTASENFNYSIFDGDANKLGTFGSPYLTDLMAISGDYAVIAGRDSPVVRILKRRDRSDARLFEYSAGYVYDEARINGAFTRVMLYSCDGFRLYDMNGNLLCETEIPGANRVYDQQYDKLSGNLAVLYSDALRIYSGTDGSLLFEKTDLHSVFYASYGISILERDGSLSLVRPDTAEASAVARAEGRFAAYCGTVVDESFLGRGELIGSAQTGGGYLFAVSNGAVGAVYNDSLKKLFDIETGEHSEAFFAGNVVIISPMHGTPLAYNIKTGKKITGLEQDAYLIYVTQLGRFLVSDYMTAGGGRYGILLDGESLEPLAVLPGLTDIAVDMLVFDYRLGDLRGVRVYSLEELKETARKQE